MDSDPSLMGNRILRILLPGPSKPHRDPIPDARSVKGHARNHHNDSLCSLLNPIYESPADKKLSLRKCVPGDGSVFYF